MQEKIIPREGIFHTWVCTHDYFLKSSFRNVAIFIRNMIGSFCTRDTRSSIAELADLHWSALMFFKVASCDRVTVRHKRVKTAPYFHDELRVER